ncbi:MAG: hypothetical protein TEF_12865 [Rhizobiales bacterium NRL2]|mgnify:CR=1 FL=1|jgi:hypothetical protein|nr:MAG: hypothetical protein TEF_12865 [Rhizobiales bacterium NRL2]
MERRLALYTFAVFARPAEDPANDGFHRRNDAVFAAAERAPGFIARSGYTDDPGPESWGVETYPRFYVERGDGWSPATLSLWTGLEPAFAFSYGRRHREALKHRRSWFVRGEWPSHALWWVEADRRPEWAEAARKLERLHDFGPGPDVFDFGTPFDPEGVPARIDVDKARPLHAAD